MKKIITLGLIIFSASYISAQTIYEVKELGTDYSQSQIDQAFATANFCGFYYSSENRVLNFDDGAVIELKNATDLPAVDSGCFIKKQVAHMNEIWRLSDDGHLLRVISINPTK